MKRQSSVRTRGTAEGISGLFIGFAAAVPVSFLSLLLGLPTIVALIVVLSVWAYVGIRTAMRVARAGETARMKLTAIYSATAFTAIGALGGGAIGSLVLQRIAPVGPASAYFLGAACGSCVLGVLSYRRIWRDLAREIVADEQAGLQKTDVA